MYPSIARSGRRVGTAFAIDELNDIDVTAAYVFVTKSSRSDSRCIPSRVGTPNTPPSSPTDLDDDRQFSLTVGTDDLDIESSCQKDGLIGSFL